MTARITSGHSPHCPDCDSTETRHIGRIPAAIGFAGRTLKAPLDGGQLWRCGTCYLAFRWPTLSKPEFDALYAEGAEYAWNNSPTKRRDWYIAKQWILEALPDESTILDVGCFDGGFLGFLGNTYRRYGIEINPAAHRRAERKGIRMIGTNFESFPEDNDHLDFVTAFDVIEHVHQPALFLERCRDMVRPGGWVLISTGNIDSLSFRFMGAGYWYCTTAEHLSFLSPKWCYKIANELSLVSEKHTTFSHGSRDFRHYPPDLIKNTFYRITPGFFGWLRQHGLGKLDAKNNPELAIYPPSWITAKDHFIMLFQRR